MATLLEGRHIQFFFTKRLDSPSYILVLSGSLNFLFCASFCQTLSLPEYLSIQLEILTQHSQSSAMIF